MATHDKDPHTGRRRQAKRSRTGGVGRTGARFPPADIVDEPVSEPEPDLPADEEVEIGRTGARFGPYSVRKPKQGKQSTDDLPAEPEQRGSPLRAFGMSPPGEAAPQAPLPWASAIVRPYAHTGGRTRSSHELAIEALISTSGPVTAAPTTPQRRMIMELCAQPRSVAEVAALLSVPLGVARVLLGDLATDGAVVVHPTASAGADAPSVDILQRVLIGLRRL